MTPITRVMKYFFAHPKPDMQWSKQIWEGTSLMSIPCFQWQTEGAWTTGLKFKFLNQDKGSCDPSDILTISSINFNMVSQTLKLFELVDVKYFVNHIFCVFGIIIKEIVEFIDEVCMNIYKYKYRFKLPFWSTVLMHVIS